MPLSRRGRLGFTLVELMISVALSTLVSILIYTVFISQTQAFRAQADMGSMQQNLRVAMEMLTRDISTAGFGTGWDGGSWGTGGHLGMASSPIYGLHVRENFQAEGPDAVEILMMDPDRTIWGTTDMAVRQPCSTTTITFHSDYPLAAAQYDASGVNSRIMCFSPAVRGRPASFVWEVDGQGTGFVVPVVANITNDFNAECPNNLPLMMICGPPVYVAYYLDKNATDNVGIGGPKLPVLYYVPDVFASHILGGYPTVDDIPIALGIEDLQIQACEPGLGTDCDLATSWHYAYDPSTTTVSWANLGGIRIMLTARTLRTDEKNATVSKSIDLDSADTFIPTSGLDGYHRRVARTEVAIRNAAGSWQLAKGNW